MRGKAALPPVTQRANVIREFTRAQELVEEVGGVLCPAPLEC